MIAIIDYGMGNLRSVEKAVASLGYVPVVTSSREDIAHATHVILPGVGAVADAMQRLGKAHLDDAIYEAVDAGTPFLGICLGMQMMLEESLENGRHACLGLVKGRVVPFEGPEMEGLRIPHIGWNDIEPVTGTILSPLDDPFVYFVHSFHAADMEDDAVAARCTYGKTFPCAIETGNLYGMQFHPEKSGHTGMKLLRRFLETSL